MIINPYAGIGGALALKGSDGKVIREQALAMGASKQSSGKTRLALELIIDCQQTVHCYVAAGEMGEDLVKSLGFTYTPVYQAQSQQTEGTDTELATQAMLTESVDLLLFAGGDGTARNICKVIDSSTPVVGIPAGCKIHSGVYAVTPQAAGRLLKQVIQGEIVSVQQVDVMDIDEALFRQGKVKAKLYGQMQVPSELQYIQAVKMGGKGSEELVLADIAAHVIELMVDNPDTIFVMGSGSTVAAIMQDLNIDNTLLGVDLVQEQQLLATDVTSEQLLAKIKGKKCKLVITLIGGQGHLLGRGNQQLSAEFIQAIGKQNIIVVATKSKLQALVGRPLIVDSGDARVNETLSGLITVVTGYQEQVLYPVHNYN